MGCLSAPAGGRGPEFARGGARSAPDYISLVKRLVLLAAGCLALAGCGNGSRARAVGLKDIPLPAGTTIAARALSCDRGANAYCSVQLVVTGSRYGSSAALEGAEQRLLESLKWGFSNGQTGHELAALSPGNELRLTFAPAYEDLLAIDFGWIQRTAAISHALSGAIFDRASAISILLERGPS